MKKLFLIILTVCSLTIQAKTAGEMFITMPDTLLPYISEAGRTELLGLKTINPDSAATLQNAIGEATLTKLTKDMINVQLSDAITLEIGRISDNRYVVIKTFGAPEKESSVIICDSLWQIIEKKDFSKIFFFTDSLLLQNNSSQLNEIRKMVEFPLIEVHLTDTPGTIILTLNAPFLSTEDKTKLRKSLVHRVLKI